MSDEAHRELPVSRRDVICGGGASVFSAMIAALLGGTRAAPAEALSGSVPEVDALAVRVVTDSYQFAVAPAKPRTASRSSTSAGASAATSRPVGHLIKPVDAC